ncbi:MAG: helix-turn-helix transcriptional regulator [Lachnospiraceae bacterium]|nr:helix-turn-helix transcriptional regulator [Lachnospiraceae bacterium]MBQ6094481.1 helix-turn-helix transcriptional regulator [Lachnospiraceae bacterium]
MEISVLEYHKKDKKVYSQLDGHFHSVYEIYYFISGDADIMVEGKIYPLKPHTLFLITPGVLHGIRVNSRADYVRNVLFLSPDNLMPERRQLLTDIMPGGKKKRSLEVLYEHTEAYHLDDFFYQLHRLDDQPQEIREMFSPIFLEALLAQIHLLGRELKPATFVNALPDKMLEIINYVNGHLTENQTLDDIASHFFISKNYLNANFKKYLGTTTMDYVRNKRIILARQAMQNGASAMDAALQSGFTDYSSFYRAYVKYAGTSPRADMLPKDKD